MIYFILVNREAYQNLAPLNWQRDELQRVSLYRILGNFRGTKFLRMGPIRE